MVLALGCLLFVELGALLRADITINNIDKISSIDKIVKMSEKKENSLRKKEKVGPKILDGGSDPIWVRTLDHYLKFRKSYLKDHNFLHMLAQGQNPQIMVVACCDSRVDPALILQAYLGDLFVVRNVANIVPVYSKNSCYQGTGASLEYGVKALKVKHLIILGHSQCGGVRGALEGVGIPNDFITRWVSQIQKIRNANFDVDEDGVADAIESLENAGIDSSIIAEMLARISLAQSDVTEDSLIDSNLLESKDEGIDATGESFYKVAPAQGLPNEVVDAYAKEALRMSYKNSMAYPWIKEAVARGELIIHPWFFDIKKAILYIYSPKKQRFEALSDKALAAFLASHHDDLI